MRKRVRTLLVPYLLWEVVAVLFFAALAVVGNMRNGRSIGDGVDMTLWGVLSGMGLWGDGFIGPPSHGALWYVRALLLFVLTFPIWRGIVRRFGWWCIAALWCVALFFACRQIDFPGWWKGFLTWTFPLSGLIYFAAGLLLSERPVAEARARRLANCALPIGVLALAYMLWMAWRGVMVSTAWRLALVPGLIGTFWFLIPSTPWPRVLTGLSFPLFIVHYFFAIFYWFYFPRWANESVLMYAVKLVLSVGGSWVVIAAFRKVLPRVYAMAFGGRGG